ncbi:FxSxx-COOH system tetratricopeptide repeat protein [Streptomyces sp. NBC_00882]|uniref:FxSxx-COOH system tetratricopeptide repeat protein n=1 Tax=Streptomyces TaxID=1883 RepID=UPI003870ADD7|nr:FxSxx-COOH system tetratricopeptide repeat protein [Streptomyces sp. NBC_00882]WSZ56144.1 FxSxx-COOH system tetratricopeptide repeat protein [Streptomyces canus]
MSSAAQSGSEQGRNRATVVTFYSHKGGVGRTMALANVAWLLADAGHRVLIVDWDLESPGLNRFVRPFLPDPELRESTGVVEMILDYGRAVDALEARGLSGEVFSARLAELLERHTQVGNHTDRLKYRFTRPEGRLDFLGPGLQDSLYSERVATFEWNRFYREQGGRRFAEALRESLRTSDYDYVLIDSRTGHSDNASLCTLILPDVVVVGFNLSNQSIDGSASVARQVRERSAGGVRVLPVPMRVDDSKPEQAERRRARARSQFEGACGPILHSGELQYWREVEVKHLPNLAYEEVLIPFALPNFEPSVQKQAYERLAQEISGDRTLRFAPLPDTVRSQYMGAFTEVPAPPRLVRLVFEPQDRAYADWIRAELNANAVPCDFDPGPGDRAARTDAPGTFLVLMSSAMVSSPQLTALAAHLPKQDALANGAWVDVAWLEDVEVQKAFRNRPGPKLYTLDEASARTALLTHYISAERRPAAWADRLGRGPRFPRRHPREWHVPHQRQGEFLGREGYLRTLRNALQPGEAAQPVVLHGQAGVGKRTLATEYVHRFGADYDVVWWMPADSADRVERELVQLSVRLGAARPSSPRAVEALREQLEGRRAGAERLLLVYDDARHPEMIASLLINNPHVHLLITSEHPDWGALGRRIDVEPPTAAEAVRYLRRKAPDLTPELAEHLVQLGEPLPQLLDQMAAYLRSTARPAQEVVAELAQSIESRQAVGQHTASAVWQSVVEDLGKERPAALDLMKMLTVLSPEGVGWELLESPAALAFLGLSEGAEGRRQLGFAARGLVSRSQGRMCENGKRFRAARMNLASQRQALTDQETAELASRVRQVLAAYSPPDDRVDDQDMNPRYAELDAHVDPCGAAEDDNLDVRRWLVNQVRYRRRSQRLDAAFTLARRLDEVWTARSSPDDDTQQLLLMRLRAELANIHMDAGRYAEANRVNGKALEELRRLQDLDGHFTLRSALPRGAQLRALGRPQDALAEEQSTREVLRARYGLDNHFTLMASHNLALSLAMVGLPQDSMEQHEDVYTRRIRVSGEQHPLTLLSSLYVGSRLLEVGRYEASLTRLQEINRVVRSHEDFGPSDLITLRTAFALGSTLRHIAALSPSLSDGERLDKADSARMCDVQAVDGLEAYGGPEHPETLAARVALAADLRLVGRTSEAIDRAERNLAAYRTWGDEHLFTRICEVNLALCLRDAEDETAAEYSERGLTGLRRILHVDPRHPLVLMAAVCHADMLVFAGNSLAARELYERTHRDLGERLGTEHPLTLAVAAQLGLREDAGGRARPDGRVGVELDIPTI